ncbi:hypothetical protein ACHAWF_000974 [Thalassiosira exigua]
MPSGTKRNHSPSKGLCNSSDGLNRDVSSPPPKKAISDGDGEGSAAGREDGVAAAPSSPPAPPRSDPPGPPGEAVVEANEGEFRKRNGEKPSEDEDEDDRTSRDYYFDSYSHHGIHEEMLKDEVRTRTYQMAICGNPSLFEGRTVLDVGCGTGILSMFAVRAGAEHVYAVDCSSIVETCRQIVSDNGMSDRITVIKGKMEDVTLPVEEVDVIVSEWMGYFLLYESMLNTVLYARDKYLRTGGIVCPDKSVMYVCACEDEQMKYERIDFWEDVYGFDMSALKDIALKEPVVDVVDPKSVVTTSVPILNVDLQSCTEEDLSFAAPFRLVAQRDDRIHSLVAYFECAFTRTEQPLGFSTSPFSKYTHWKQTIFYLDEPLSVHEGEELTGTISCAPNPRNKRDLDITVDLSFDGAHAKIRKKIEYRLR